MTGTARKITAFLFARSSAQQKLEQVVLISTGCLQDAARFVFGVDTHFALRPLLERTIHGDSQSLRIQQKSGLQLLDQCDLRVSASETSISRLSTKTGSRYG
jgi:hypothetical protein